MSSIVNAMPFPALLLDSNRMIVTANDPAVSLFESQLNKMYLVRVLRHPEVLAMVAQSIKDNEMNTRRVGLTFQTQRTFEVTVAPAGDRLEGLYLMTLADMSAEIQAERSRSTFVANVSHELRSPLTSLIGMVETLRGPARNDQKAQDRFLALMDDETQRMSRIVMDLLSLSKFEAQEHIVPSDSVDIVEVIKRTTSALEASDPDYPGRIKIQMDDNIPAIRGDTDLLIEVFQNILENALRYSPPQSDIEVKISQRDPKRAGSQRGVKISVQDYGDGIEDAHIPRLTERFYRVDKGRSREMGGTGLGLAIVKHIINRHRGRMVIDSDVGKGTCVSVYLMPFEG